MFFCTQRYSKVLFALKTNTDTSHQYQEQQNTDKRLQAVASKLNQLPYSGKILRAINFAVFKDFTAALKINSSKSCHTTEYYDNLVDPQNLICESYCGEIISKISSLKNYPLYGN